MPRRSNFEFNEEAQRRLVECLNSARSAIKEDLNRNCGLKKCTAALFKNVYPECHLNEKTLYNRAIHFQKKNIANDVNANVDITKHEINSDIASEKDDATDTESVMSSSLAINDSDSSFGSVIPASFTSEIIPSSICSNDGRKSESVLSGNVASDSSFKRVTRASSGAESVASSICSSDGTNKEKTSRPKFAWDDRKKTYLLTCYNTATRSSESIVKILDTEFKKLFPECTLNCNTLCKKARQFKKELEKEDPPSVDAPPKRSDSVALEIDDGNDSVFNEIVTPASVPGDKTKFLWNKQKEQQLLECLKMLVTKKGDNRRIEIRLHEEFVKLYPNYPFKPTTLYRNATALESGARKTLTSAKPKIPTWYGEKEAFLIQCAVDAHEENKTNIALGAYEGKRGLKSKFEAILIDKFREIHPELTADAVTKKFYDLKKKYKLEFEVPTPTLTDQGFARIMSYWQHGYVMSTRKLFEGCCHVCSTLIVYHGRGQSTSATIEPEHVPVLDHYPEECLQERFKKTPTQYYKCNVCKGKNLLDLYPLAPQGVKILPIPEQVLNMTGPEKHKIGMMGMFSTTAKLKDSKHATFEHRRGELTAWPKTDQRYFEMYAIMFNSSLLEEKLRPPKIVTALLKLREINPLYQQFYANYETMFRYFPAQPNAPSAIPVFDKKIVQPLNENQTIDMLLEDEPAALLIPDSDLEARGTAPMSETVAGLQHAKDMAVAEYKRFLGYSDRHLAEKVFPWLHPYGTGGWQPDVALPMGLFYRWRISMLDDRFRSESNYYFYFLDYLLKNRIQFCNSVKVNLENQREPLKKQDFDVRNIYTSKYGTEVPSTIPNSRNFWYVKCNELLALSEKIGRQPDFFVTLTQNDNWPEVQAVFRNGTWARAEIDGKEYIDLRPKETEPAVDHPYEMVEAFYRRLQEFKDRVLHNPDGPFGKVLDYWYRIEYQQRGGLHVHMVVWCDESTVPEDAISAELPRFEHPHNEKWREYVKRFQMHKCIPRCYTAGKTKVLRRCKYGFPFVLCDRVQPDETGVRHLYVRRHAEDMRVSPYNLPLLLFWGAHVNVQKVTDNGWELYLAKYVAKAATAVRVTIEPPKYYYVPNQKSNYEKTEVERYLTTRLVSSLECCAILLQKHHAGSSRDMIYLPVDVEPRSRFVKRRKHMMRTDPDSDDIYYDTKLEKYLDRPDELAALTYPQFYARYYYGRGAQRPAYPDNNLFDEAPEEQDERPTEDDGAKEPALRDKAGRYLRRRKGKEAVAYFRHFSPYGKQMEQYCLRRLLENVPVNRETVHSLLERTGSYMQECLDRNLIGNEEGMYYLQACVKRGYNRERLLDTAEKLIESHLLEDQDVTGLLETVAPYHMAIDEMMARESRVDDNDDSAGLLNVRPRLPLHQYVEKFSESQRQAYKYITSRWAENKAVRAFVCGEAGSGKSFLIDALAAYCKENERTIQKLGTTGCASYLIGGLTVHTFFKLDVHLNTYLEKGTNDAYFVKKVEIIMIDEASMLDADLLLKVDEILRDHTERNQLMFGGKSFLLFGDVAQLPAVNRNIWNEDLYARRFDTIVLRQNMRTTDHQFQELLNRVRVNKMTPEDRNLLKSRVVSRELPLPNIDTINAAYLVSRRKIKAAYDDMRLHQLPGEVMRYYAEDVDEHGKRVSKAMEEFISDIERISNLLPSVLEIKPGAKVMLLRNLNFRHGWVNGRMATVLCATKECIVLQAVDNERFVTTVERMKQEITWPNCKRDFKFYRIQFPVQLAYAVTVHKGQGHTLDQVVVRAKSFFVTGQFYTAISRVRKLKDLFFTELELSANRFHPAFAELLQWFDEVDVLRKDSDGEKPSMPWVPETFNLTRKTKKGEKRFKPIELYEGLFSDSSEDEKEVASAEKKKTSKATAEKAAVVRPAPITSMPMVKNDESTTTFKKPLPVKDTRVTILKMFADVKAIPKSLGREAYTAAFRKATSDVNLTGFINNMRNANKTVTYKGYMRKDVYRQKQLYTRMSEHCTVVHTAGEGHCMFYMAAISLFGNESQHLQIRAAVMATFIENWQHFQDQAVFYGYYDTVQELVQNACCFDDGQIGWGSNAHLKAIAIASGRKVYLYNGLSAPDARDFKDVPANEIQRAIDQGTTQHLLFSPSDRVTDDRVPIMTILYEQHYAAILNNTPQSRIFVPRGIGDINLRDMGEPRSVVHVDLTSEENELNSKAFKEPQPTKSNRTALLEMFRNVKAISKSLGREAYAAEFRKATNNVNLAALKANMRNAKNAVTYESSMEVDSYRKGQLYNNMSKHCTVVATSGGGHCMFNMASINLFGNERQHLQIRAAVMATFVENWQYFRDQAVFYGYYDTVQELVQNTCRFDEGEIGWGSNAHLKAIAIASGRAVYVYVLPLTKPDVRKFKKVPADKIQRAIDEGTTLHSRYSPFDWTEDRVPIMTAMSEKHYAAILKNTPQSMVFKPNGIGDSGLEHPLDASDNNEPSKIKKSASTESLADLFDSQIKFDKTPMEDLISQFQSLSSEDSQEEEKHTPVVTRRKRKGKTSVETSPATPRSRRKVDDKAKSEQYSAEKSQFTPSKGKKRTSSLQQSPPATPRTRRKTLSESMTDRDSSTDSLSSITSQISSSSRRSSSERRKTNEREVKKLLEEITKIPARTHLPAYVKRVLELTEAAETNSFLESVRTGEPAVYRRSMPIQASAERLFYRALTKRARIVRTNGCIFHACCVDLFGNDTRHLELRAAICHVISKHYKYFEMHEQTLGIRDSVQKLIYNTSRCDKTQWANRDYNAYLKAIATIANRQVYMYLMLEDQRNASVDEKTLQSAIDDGQTNHTRYQPIDGRNPERTPLLLFKEYTGFHAMLPLQSGDSFIAKPKVMY